ncbi:hypothetical protein V6Z11_A05G369400 [Gossypium hirsutum]
MTTNRKERTEINRQIQLPLEWEGRKLDSLADERRGWKNLQARFVFLQIGGFLFCFFNKRSF